MYGDTPGTVRLFTETGELLNTTPQLIPKPSQDPEDPLNWSRLRKNVSLACLVLWVLHLARRLVTDCAQLHLCNSHSSDFVILDIRAAR